jgi:hypothetical protein
MHHDVGFLNGRRFANGQTALGIEFVQCTLLSFGKFATGGCAKEDMATNALECRR